MRKEYDFSKAIRNPYAAKLKKQITIRIDAGVIEYFKALANEFDMPYQNLINLYLKDCTVEGRKPKFQWIELKDARIWTRRLKSTIRKIVSDRGTTAHPLLADVRF